MSVVPPSNSVETRSSGTKANVSLVIATFSSPSIGSRTSIPAGITAATAVNPSGPRHVPVEPHRQGDEEERSEVEHVSLLDALRVPGSERGDLEDEQRRGGHRHGQERALGGPGRATVLQGQPEEHDEGAHRDEADRVLELSEVEGRPAHDSLERVPGALDAAVLAEHVAHRLSLGGLVAQICKRAADEENEGDGIARDRLQQVTAQRRRGCRPGIEQHLEHDRRRQDEEQHERLKPRGARHHDRRDGERLPENASGARARARSRAMR